MREVSPTISHELKDRAPLVSICKGTLGTSALGPGLSPQTLERPEIKQPTGCGGECPDCPDGPGEKTITTSDCPHFNIGPNGEPVCDNQNTFVKQMRRSFNNGGIDFGD